MDDVSGFEPNAVLRGAQLTLVGAYRALQNPAIFTTGHYRQAMYSVMAGVAIRLALNMVITTVKLLLRLASIFYPLETVSWDESVIEWLQFTGDYVLQVPFFLMTIMRHFVPTLDNLFMLSLDWVDITYIRKHKDESPDALRELYYPNLSCYPSHGDKQVSAGQRRSFIKSMSKYARRAIISIGVFALSYVPVVGPLVLPLMSFYTFHRAVGLGPAVVTFGSSLFLPRRYLVIFLQSYYSSRNLMRELLDPYFSRVRFTKEEKRNWFRSREGVLFGFALGFYILMRVPLFGVLIYGIAEASTAYLITKITDPPPPPPLMRDFATSQQQWRNKHEFLNLSLSNLDSLRTKPSQSSATMVRRGSDGN